MAWIIIVVAILEVLGVVIYFGAFSTFAKLQRLTSRDPKAFSALVEYIGEHSDEWKVSGPREKGSTRIYVLFMCPEDLFYEHFDLEEYERRKKATLPVPFYYKYIGGDNILEAEERLYEFVRNLDSREKEKVQVIDAWHKVVDSLNSQPRLQIAMLKARSIYGNGTLSITVDNLAQKKWLDERIKKDFEDELKKIVGMDVMIKFIVEQ